MIKEILKRFFSFWVPITCALFFVFFSWFFNSLFFELFFVSKQGLPLPPPEKMLTPPKNSNKIQITIYFWFLVFLQSPKIDFIQLFLLSRTFQCFLSTPPFLLLALLLDSFRASPGSFSLRSALAFLARSLRSSGSSHSVEWGNHFGAASTP